MPDCVPEFYRAQQEAADHQYELLLRCREHYRANQEKVSAATASGLPILPYGGYTSCWMCQVADYDTRTDDDDDFDCVICHNPACPEYIKKQ